MFALALRQAVDLSHFGNSGESSSTKEFFEIKQSMIAVVNTGVGNLKCMLA